MSPYQAKSISKFTNRFGQIQSNVLVFLGKVGYESQTRAAIAHTRREIMSLVKSSRVFAVKQNPHLPQLLTALR